LLEIRCRKISRGFASGEAMVSDRPMSFLGDIDPETGVVVDPSNPLFGRSVKGRILIFTTGKGSTVGSYIIYQMSKNGTAPAAIICKEAEPIVAVGAIIAEIPMVDKPEVFDFKDGQKVTVDGGRGLILVQR